MPICAKSHDILRQCNRVNGAPGTLSWVPLEIRRAEMMNGTPRKGQEGPRQEMLLEPSNGCLHTLQTRHLG